MHFDKMYSFFLKDKIKNMYSGAWKGIFTGHLGWMPSDRDL
jgi:hypothetical protein